MSQYFVTEQVHLGILVHTGSQVSRLSGLNSAQAVALGFNFFQGLRDLAILTDQFLQLGARLFQRFIVATDLALQLVAGLLQFPRSLLQLDLFCACLGGFGFERLQLLLE